MGMGIGTDLRGAGARVFNIDFVRDVASNVVSAVFVALLGILLLAAFDRDISWEAIAWSVAILIIATGWLLLVSGYAVRRSPEMSAEESAHYHRWVYIAYALATVFLLVIAYFVPGITRLFTQN